MRILYIIPSLVQSGPINVVADLVNVMTAHGHMCDVAYFDENSDRSICKFPCHTFKVSKIDWQNYDIIHTHCFRPNLFARLKMPKRLRPHLVSTMHNLMFDENAILHGKIKGYLYSSLELWAVKKHPNIIVLTEFAKNYYKNLLPSKQLHVCYNTRVITPAAPDSDDVKLITQFKQDSQLEYLIGTHCSVIQRKGLDQVISALEQLPNIGFIIIGDGPESANLEKEAHKKNVSHRLLMMGHRSNASRYLPLFDMFVIPSRSEGFPLGLLEAASMGIPSLSSDIEIFKETFPEDDTLPKFSLDNTDSLVQKIKLVLKNKDTYGKNIRRKYNENYSPEIFYQQHINVYNQILNK